MTGGRASESSNAEVQQLLAERQTQVMNGDGDSAEAHEITDEIAAIMATD